MFSTAYPCMSSWRQTLNESADFYIYVYKKTNKKLFMSIWCLTFCWYRWKVREPWKNLNNEFWSVCPACFMSTEDVYREGSQSSESRSGCTANCCLHPFDFLSGTESPRWSSPHSVAHKSTRKPRRMNSDNLCLSSPGSAHSPIKSCVLGLKGNTENIFGTLPCGIGESTHIKRSWSPVFLEQWTSDLFVPLGLDWGSFWAGAACMAGLQQLPLDQEVEGGGQRDWWEKGDGGAFVWAAATSCTSPINLCPREMQRIALAFHLLACSTDLVLLGPPLLQHAVYFQAPMYSEVIIL